MLAWGKEYAIADAGRWLNDHTWRASVDISSLVPRGSYAVAVNGARGTDGMAAWPGERPVFTVDYASQISDRTPPLSPNVFASGRRGDPSVVEIAWSAHDPDSPITAYRYAIGSAPGTSDIVSWTSVIPDPLTTDRGEAIVHGLYLVAGHQYWAAVRACNSGGLWSVGSYRPFIAGQPSFRTLFVPFVSR
jgi:hypothetical protein